MKVLIAEDDVSTRCLLELMLEQWGYNVISTATGTDARLVFDEQEAPQLALLDWDMPGMDGMTLCKEIKQLVTTTPVYVILITGRGDKTDIVRGLDAGADDYIVKPFDQYEFRARIRVAERMIQIQNILAAKVADLQNALTHVKVLQGIIPICMYCHKIRNDNEAWDKIETYISRHSDATLSHGICPECLDMHLPEDNHESP